MAGKKAKLKLKLKQASAARKVTRALGGKVKATVTVTFSDAAGNVATKKKPVKLK